MGGQITNVNTKIKKSKMCIWTLFLMPRKSISVFLTETPSLLIGNSIVLSGDMRDTEGET